MANEIIKPETNELTFELIDNSSQKKNTFYLNQTLTTQNRITVLKLNALTDKEVEFHYSGVGNCNESNFSFSLVFPLYLINVDLLPELKLVNVDVKDWDYFSDQTETELKLYFLATKECNITKDGFEILIQNLPIAQISTGPANVAFLYKREDEPESIYCLQSGLDVFNHSGINSSPFKLVNDTPLLSTVDGKNLELRLLNCTNNTLDISKLTMQVQFDVYENKVKSPQALVNQTTFQNPSFGIDVFTENGIEKIGSFEKSTAADQSIYRGILNFNPNHSILSSLKEVKPLGQLILKFEFSTAHSRPGESPIVIHYFNIDDYWDGELQTVVKRTAYFENAKDVMVHKSLKLQQDLTVAESIHSLSKIKEGTGDLIPEGSIVMWSGSNPPLGWALCDGSTINGTKTPDLRGRFIVGKGSDSSIGDKGGLAEVKLDISQMPNHNHTGTANKINITKHNGSEGFKLMGPQAYNAKDAYDTGSKKSGYDSHQEDPRSLNDAIHLEHEHTLEIDPVGGGLAHENRPPYYTLAFIIKI